MELCKNMFRKNVKIYNIFGIHPKYISHNHMLYQLDQLENILISEKKIQEILLLLKNVESTRLVDFVWTFK